MIPYNYHKIPQQRFDHNDRLQTPASKNLSNIGKDNLRIVDLKVAIT